MAPSSVEPALWLSTQEEEASTADFNVSFCPVECRLYFLSFFLVSNLFTICVM